MRMSITLSLHDHDNLELLYLKTRFCEINRIVAVDIMTYNEIQLTRIERLTTRRQREPDHRRYAGEGRATGEWDPLAGYLFRRV